ncbi:hypothetical protein NBM05_10685 [Rothia sp. AR01]|uniref:Uncharacterized protein n=1 Tax=Rothia santali TaxID=2949643 RepID=A0A9X2HE63_9MICC|nr:DUF6541 family protein [Rothia santali]MCP3426455.1 hypothetical protein [Rothia santali]
MEWLTLALPLALCLLLVVVPGLLVTLSVRLRGFDAVALAPSISIALTAVSAIVAPLLGISWSWWVPLAAGLGTAILAGLVAWGLRRVGLGDFPAARSTPPGRPVAAESASHPGSAAGPGAASHPGSAAAPGAARNAAPATAHGPLPSRWLSREQGAYWIALALAAVLTLRQLTNGIGAPGWFSQTFDNNFHLNAVRYIAETGNGSSLTVNAMTSGGGETSFYPAAWHDVVALVFTATGSGSVPEATNAMILAVGAVVWPFSMLFLLRSMLRLNLPAILVSAAVLTGFSAFPLLLIFFGVLYPNFLGLALLPAALGVVLNLFRVGGARRLSTVQAVLVGVPAALGVALAHPNALMSLLVMAVPIVVVRALAQIWGVIRGRVALWAGALQVVVCAALLWTLWILWGIVRPDEGAATWEPTATDSQAFGEALLNSPLSLTTAQWSVSVLALVGVAAVLATRRNLWALLTYGVVVYFYIAVRYLSWDQDRMWVTGVWYNDPYRLAALVPLAAIPLAVVGVHWVTQAILDSPWVRGGFGRSAQGTARTGGAVVALAVVALVAAVGATQFSRPLSTMMDNAYWTYYPGQDAPLVDADELDVIENLDAYVPEDATVVVNPWTGGSLAYALADREVTAHHTLYTKTADDDVLDGYLNQAATDPRVCEVVDELDARYVLDFGDQEINGGYHLGAYQGLQNLEEDGVAEEVYSSGDAKLLEVTACGDRQAQTVG